MSIIVIVMIILSGCLILGAGIAAILLPNDELVDNYGIIMGVVLLGMALANITLIVNSLSQLI